MSSTDQIYHLAALRLADKFDRSMTLGKLLNNNAQLFIFISYDSDAVLLFIPNILILRILCFDIKKRFLDQVDSLMPRHGIEFSILKIDHNEIDFLYPKVIFISRNPFLDIKKSIF